MVGIGSIFDDEEYRPVWYFGGMKVKTSVTLSRELIEAIDQQANCDSRSDFLERAAWEVIKRIQRQAGDAHDAAIYAKYGDEYNADAEDALEYQSTDW